LVQSRCHLSPQPHFGERVLACFQFLSPHPRRLPLPQPFSCQQTTHASAF
jgi:hypothetical protein